jgi:DNA-binding SARP family transcriptional activator/predicted ATPase/Flp pilus assembly protein TadD
MKTGIAEITMQCFGGFHLEIDEKETHNFSTDKARALLIYLAIQAPHRFQRSHLAGLLWSDFSEEQALHNLRQTLVTIKKAIPAQTNHPPLLITYQNTIAINPDLKFWVDVNAFDHAYHNGIKHFTKDQHLDQLNLVVMKEALLLFKGPFLEHFSLNASPLFDEWVLTIQENSNQKAAHLMALLCEYYERRAEYFDASELTDGIIKITPWDETAYIRSMRLYAVQKQWAKANKRYLQLKTYLHESFAIQPDDEVFELHALIKRSALGDGRILPEIQPAPCHLPEPGTPFFGRKQEIKDLVSMLADSKKRMVTVHGMGGIGKTRLAIEIGELLRGLYLGGVFFINLSETTGFTGFIHKIAEFAGISFSGIASHPIQVINYFREKRCLLILDCFEHLTDNEEIQSFLTNLLKNAPGVKFLVTSQEPLSLIEEHIYHLQGLSSGIAEQQDEQDLGKSDALSLFENRAQQINNQFKIDHQTLKLVEKLCQFVEGHPLSIELLASNTRASYLSNLLTEIEENLLAIKSPMINGLNNQKSLAAVLERSWSNLDEAQRQTLASLACFRGSFSLDAAIKVGKTNKEILYNLVDKCLLRASPAERFVFHEIIRQFAHHKSIETGLCQPSTQSYAEYYISMLEEIAEKNPWVYSEDALEQIHIEQENMLNSWHYFIHNREWKRLQNSLEPIYHFFSTRSQYQEGIDLFSQTVTAMEEQGGYELLTAKLKLRIGFLAHRLRQDDLAYATFLDGKKIAEVHSNQGELGRALSGLASCYLRNKQFDQAIDHALKSIICLTACEDTPNLANAYELLGLIYNRTANFTDAKEMLEKSIALSKKINDRRGMISSLNQLGDLACNDGDFETAECHFLEALEYSRSFKDRFNQAILLNNLASVYRPLNAYDQEEQVLLESLAICRDIGDQDGEAIALNNLGELAVVLGNFHQAIKYCQQSLEIALKIGEDWTIIINYDILGEAYLHLDQADTAFLYFTQAIQAAYKIQSWDLLTRALVNAAGMYRRKGDIETAHTFLVAAISHPGVIYEFSKKGIGMLQEMGFEIPDHKNERLLENLLRDHLNIG